MFARQAIQVPTHNEGRESTCRLLRKHGYRKKKLHIYRVQYHGGERKDNP